MRVDLRESELYLEAASLYRNFRRPGAGLISDAADISTDGKRVFFTGSIVETLDRAASTRICVTSVADGDTRVLTFGPNADRMPRLSPDGRTVAFLSDRHEAGNFQLYLLDLLTGAAIQGARVDGWLEYLHWSPDGTRILLGVAGHGADVSGGQGAITSKLAEDLPDWMPRVDSGEDARHWRRIWIYDVSDNTATPCSDRTLNVWEATWCGEGSICAVVSDGPGESLWYSAKLVLQPLEVAANVLQLYRPCNQLGVLSVSPSGRTIAFVEALCSDRNIIAGDLRLIDVATGEIRHVTTNGIDVSHAEWRSDQVLLVAGHRGFEIAVAVYDLESGSLVEHWASCELSAAGHNFSICGYGRDGDFAFVAENFATAPQIVTVRNGRCHIARSFAIEVDGMIDALVEVSAIAWTASDGLEIQGWLLRPPGDKTCPLIMFVHGGPVGHWRPRYLGRASMHVLMLLRRGYAVFFPNPRGSNGRGQAFVRHVLGDMGGADAQDLLSGIDHLVAVGVADPKRIGVTGGSYGGFMTSWLIGQDCRFAAAVSVSPHTNQVSQHLLSNIPRFLSLFLQDEWKRPNSEYLRRSPIMHANKVRTPTLNICGALDRCTPPEEAAQFHAALLENGVESALVTYPLEGHGVRGVPAIFDYAARFVGWFERHLVGATVEK